MTAPKATSRLARTPSSTQRREDLEASEAQRARGLSLQLVALFLGLVFARSPGLFLRPRLWAEEGAFYYAPLQSVSGLGEALQHTARSNLQMLENAVVWAATGVPAASAAFVTTYASLGVALLTAWLVGDFLATYGVRRREALLTMTGFAMLPASYEVLLNATNLQWISSIAVLLIALLPLHRASRRRLCAYGLCLVLTAFSGVPATMLAPLFVLRAWHEKAWVYLGPALLLGAAALLQLSIIVGAEHPGRGFSAGPLDILVPTFLQSVCAVLLSGGLVQEFVSLTEDHAFLGALLLAFAAVCAALYFRPVAASLLEEERSRSITLSALLAWGLVSSLNVIGAIGSPSILVSGWSGGRYFYLGASCFVLMLAMATQSVQPRARQRAKRALLIVAVAGLAGAVFSDWHDFLTEGTPWSEEVARCGSTRPCSVATWPGGEDWTFSLTRP